MQVSDPVWNVTASGGTNLKCLAANTAAPWRCLLAPYIAPHVQTPMYIMNSAYDAWQMGNILKANILDPAQANAVQAYRDQFVANLTSAIAGKPKSGAFIDSSVHHLWPLRLPWPLSVDV
jgi:hypothetical protein